MSSDVGGDLKLGARTVEVGNVHRDPAHHQDAGKHEQPENGDAAVLAGGEAANEALDAGASHHGEALEEFDHLFGLDADAVAAEEIETSDRNEIIDGNQNLRADHAAVFDRIDDGAGG